ncbi:acyltransferase [Roseiflexus sp.]|uniref:acyltransferase n=1 Tax=Roseiflexus sp. TaxID=2562120 RepID=UPI00398ACE47
MQRLAPVAGVNAPPLAAPGPDGLGTSATRKSRLQIYPSPGPHNALWYFPQVTGGHLRVARNAVIIQLARYTPSLALKNVLYRLIGVRVGRCASVGLMVMFDIFFPQDITLGNNCIIGYNSTVLCHEFTRSEWRRGPVWIGHDVTIGANTTILPGAVIGDGATVSAMSLVNRDVPPGAFVGGVPVRLLRTGR